MTADIVRLEGLELRAEVGVYAHERGVKQRLVLDLAVELQHGLVERAAASDAIADALDYDRLAAIAREVVALEHHALIETIAETIATRVLDELAPRARRVSVRVAKPGAIRDARNVAIEIQRER